MSRRRSQRFLRLLLRLLPGDFRRDLGGEIEATFTLQERDTGPRLARRARLWVSTIVGILRLAPGEHWAQLRGDLAVTLRQLTQRPGFALVAVLTLSIGIAANTLVFTLVHGILLRPLPYPRAEQLLRISSLQQAEGVQAGFSLQDFEDLRATNHSLTSLAAFDVRPVTVGDEGGPERVLSLRGSANLFSTVGVAPVLGREFLPAEDKPGREPVVVLSDRLWRRRFAADPAILGQSIRVGEERAVVIGVAPPGFDFPPESGVDLWRPLGLGRNDGGGREGRWIAVVARRGATHTSSEVRADLSAVAARLAAEHPDSNAGWTFVARPLRSSLTSGSRPGLLALTGAVGLVLLIACANVANLLLAKGSSRRAEIAVRLALGASREQIGRLLLVEAALLAGCGGLLGVGSACLALGPLRRVAAGFLPRLGEVSVDGTVLLVSIFVCGLATLLSAAAPLRAATRRDLAAALRRDDPRSGTGRPRSAFAVLEVALALTLLVGAGLLLRSLAAVVAVNPGFSVRDTLTFRVEPPRRTPTRLPQDELLRAIDTDRQRVAGVFERLVSELATLPGVRAVATTNSRPLAGASTWNTTMEVSGREGEESSVRVGYRAVSPTFLETLSIPLLSGRRLAAEDRAGGLRVAVLSAAAATGLFGTEEPLGQRVRIYGDPGEEGWHTVVGVVGDVRSSRLEAEPLPLLYATTRQARWGHFLDWGTDVVVRTDAAPATIVPALRGVVAAVAPDLPVLDVRTFVDLQRADVGARRFFAGVLAVFAAIAALLAGLGLYGVLAFSVEQRRREVGVRRALGASAARVVGLLLRQSMTLTAAGLLAGGLGALAAARLLGSMLFGVSPWDPVTLACAPAVLLVSALLATLVPTRRALAVPPLTALRQE